MSIQDRDWYWEDYKKKETDYDGDFSLHSKKKKESVPPSTPYFSAAQDIVVVPRFCQKCGYKFHRWYNMIWMEKIIGQHRAGQAAIVPFTDVKMDFT